MRRHTKLRLGPLRTPSSTASPSPSPPAATPRRTRTNSMSQTVAASPHHPPSFTLPSPSSSSAVASFTLDHASTTPSAGSPSPARRRAGGGSRKRRRAPKPPPAFDPKSSLGRVNCVVDAGDFLAVAKDGAIRLLEYHPPYELLHAFRTAHSQVLELHYLRAARTLVALEAHTMGSNHSRAIVLYALTRPPVTSLYPDPAPSPSASSSASAGNVSEPDDEDAFLDVKFAVLPLQNVLGGKEPMQDGDASSPASDSRIPCLNSPSCVATCSSLSPRIAAALDMTVTIWDCQDVEQPVELVRLESLFLVSRLALHGSLLTLASASEVCTMRISVARRKGSTLPAAAGVLQPDTTTTTTTTSDSRFSVDYNAVGIEPRAIEFEFVGHAHSSALRPSLLDASMVLVDMPLVAREREQLASAHHSHELGAEDKKRKKKKKSKKRTEAQRNHEEALRAAASKAREEMRFLRARGRPLLITDARLDWSHDVIVNPAHAVQTGDHVLVMYRRLYPGERVVAVRLIPSPATLVQRDRAKERRRTEARTHHSDDELPLWDIPGQFHEIPELVHVDGLELDDLLVDAHDDGTARLLVCTAEHASLYALPPESALNQCGTDLSQPAHLTRGISSTSSNDESDIESLNGGPRNAPSTASSTLLATYTFGRKLIDVSVGALYLVALTNSAIEVFSLRSPSPLLALASPDGMLLAHIPIDEGAVSSVVSTTRHVIVVPSQLSFLRSERHGVEMEPADVRFTQVQESPIARRLLTAPPLEVHGWDAVLVQLEEPHLIAHHLLERARTTVDEVDDHCDLLPLSVEAHMMLVHALYAFTPAVSHAALRRLHGSAALARCLARTTLVNMAKLLQRSFRAVAFGILYVNVYSALSPTMEAWFRCLPPPDDAVAPLLESREHQSICVQALAWSGLPLRSVVEFLLPHDPDTLSMFVQYVLQRPSRAIQEEVEADGQLTNQILDLLSSTDPNVVSPIYLQSCLFWSPYDPDLVLRVMLERVVPQPDDEDDGPSALDLLALALLYLQQIGVGGGDNVEQFEGVCDQLGMDKLCEFVAYNPRLFEPQSWRGAERLIEFIRERAKWGLVDIVVVHVARYGVEPAKVLQLLGTDERGWMAARLCFLEAALQSACNNSTHDYANAFSTPALLRRLSTISDKGQTKTESDKPNSSVRTLATECVLLYCKLIAAGETIESLRGEVGGFEDWEIAHGHAEFFSLAVIPQFGITAGRRSWLRDLLSDTDAHDALHMRLFALLARHDLHMQREDYAQIAQEVSTLAAGGDPVFSRLQLLLWPRLDQLSQAVTTLSDHLPLLVFEFSVHFCQTVQDWSSALRALERHFTGTTDEHDAHVSTAKLEYSRVLDLLASELSCVDFLPLLPNHGSASFFVPFIQRNLIADLHRREKGAT